MQSNIPIKIEQIPQKKNMIPSQPLNHNATS